MILCFSGTGNSRYAAKLIAAQTGDRLISINSALRKRELDRANAAFEYNSSSPWVVVCPTYCWRIPRVVEAFLRESHFTGSKDFYFFLTCGDSTGAAAKHAEALCRELGYNFRGMGSVQMPENYIAMFPVPNEEKSEKIIANALPVLEKGIGCIAQRKPFPERRISLLDKAKSSFVNDIFCRYIIKSSPFRVDDRCIGCGKCADLCPLNNIELKDGKPVWNKDCTHCMACICHCPTEAIEYGRKSVGKRRYRCPEYK